MRRLIFSAIVCMPLVSYAQDITPNDSTSNSYTILQHNAPQHINTTHVPRFALLGKEGKYYIGIGADIQVVAVSDFGSLVSDPNSFETSAIPINQPPGNGSQFNLTAQQSDIYVNVVALPGTSQEIGAYVSFKFLGDGYSPSLEHAYLKFMHFTAGYTYTIFSDVAVAPATIDYEGPNSLPTIQHCMVSFEHSLDKSKRWQAGIALDVPEYSVTESHFASEVSQRLPDIPFYIQRYWNGGSSWLRLSGIVRNLYYRNNISGRNIDKVAGGINFSGKAKITGGLDASFSALWGKGICSYIQDLTALNMDMLPASSESTSLKPVEAWGVCATLNYQFSSQLFSSLTYSQVRTYAHSTVAIPNYRYAQYIAANTFYNLNSIVQIGLEYLYGRRVDYGGIQSHDNRLEAMLKVSF